jgi:hypothetical protein
MAICEKTDLDEAFCAHCRGNTKTPVEEFEAENRRLRAKLLASDPRWFPAQWPGVCGGCGTGFSPGSLIRQPAPPDYSWVAECCSAT